MNRPIDLDRKIDLLQHLHLCIKRLDVEDVEYPQELLNVEPLQLLHSELTKPWTPAAASRAALS